MGGDEFEVPTSGNPFQINQWVFYAAAPDNPLFRKLADNIMDNIRSMPTTQNVEQTLARTGPVYFTKVIVDYLKLNGEVLPSSKQLNAGRGVLYTMGQGSDGKRPSRLLILPYRAMGYVGWDKKGVVKDPVSQRLAEHDFKGSWRIEEGPTARERPEASGGVFLPPRMQPLVVLGLSVPDAFDPPFDGGGVQTVAGLLSAISTLVCLCCRGCLAGRFQTKVASADADSAQ